MGKRSFRYEIKKGETWFTRGTCYFSAIELKDDGSFQTDLKNDGKVLTFRIIWKTDRSLDVRTRLKVLEENEV
jgi:hypothetical protein